MNRAFINFFILGLLLLLLFGTSCTPYYQVPYFQDLNRSSIVTQDIKNYSPLTIHPGDILGISVTSNSDPSAVSVFNYNLNRINGVNSDYTVGNAVTGYLVDSKGEIQIPYIGNMKVEGYTTTDLKDQLSKTLTKYVNQPVVNIRFMNFRIAVMGDVLRPDIYTFSNEQVSVMQALAQAGDLNITARRQTLLLIREIDGKRQFIPLDLTSKKLFDSPYFYLKNNDILYIDPDKSKFAQNDQGYRTATLIIGAVSAASLVLTVILYHK